ncbi:MAG: hypothetical protein GWN67_25070 [Phycisphaerae bacterium]|nr:hypothetical protein [Phycisphaerae bacterium]NIP55407.1 hypothetical protein [Phycisphaerae bacterium]NIS54078.1 hypothetical protein [Phycisphaerae bacterium]NIU11720.1 hypothetical protein [Phycisphaerae bacterium]NIU59535.1 hypothetical protein [Phycisphaerae bacterium]
MNLEKGLKRLTIILSVLAGPLWLLYQLATHGGISYYDLFRYEFLIVLFVHEVIGFIVVWIIYLSTCWIVKGFQDEEAKDEKK